jgi:hypothetical protein
MSLFDYGDDDPLGMSDPTGLASCSSCISSSPRPIEPTCPDGYVFDPILQQCINRALKNLV